MNNLRICTGCQAQYMAILRGGRLRCPHCGLLQDEPSESLHQLEERSVPHEEPTAQSQATAVKDTVVRSLPVRRTNERQQFFQVFGPTFVACGIVILWALISFFAFPTSEEELLRVEDLVSDSIAAHKKGDRLRAQKLIDEAVQLAPNSNLVREVESLIRR